MKTDFIPKFINALIDTGKELNDMWNWQPLYYKSIKVKGYNRRKFYNGIKSLENRKILIRSSGGRYGFTKNGQRWLSGQLLKFHRLNKTKWGGKWRVLIFDIPQELHNKRNIFRAKLRSLGFYMIQKSIFIFPYQCEEEISECCNHLGIADYVDIIIADKLGGKEENVKKIFAL